MYKIVFLLLNGIVSLVFLWQSVDPCSLWHHNLYNWDILPIQSYYLFSMPKNMFLMPLGSDMQTADFVLCNTKMHARETCKLRCQMFSPIPVQFKCYLLNHPFSVHSQIIETIIFIKEVAILIVFFAVHQKGFSLPNWTAHCTLKLTHFRPRRGYPNAPWNPVNASQWKL